MEQLLYWIAITSLVVIILCVAYFTGSQKLKVSNTIKHDASKSTKRKAVDESLEERIRRRKFGIQ